MIRERLIGRPDPLLDDPFAPQLQACRNPACERVVRVGVIYCCGGCDRSHQVKAEPADEFEPPGPVKDMFGHGVECDERWEQRQALLPPKRRSPEAEHIARVQGPIDLGFELTRPI